MTQRTLYKTIEKLAQRAFANDQDLIKAVLDEIVHNEYINIIGGRIWQLESGQKAYRLIHEQGSIESIGQDFTLAIKDYPVFEEVAKNRTVLADETNKVLRKKGIQHYSATGIGHKIKIGRTEYFEYVMAFNAESTEDSLIYTMNIISQAVTSILQNRKSQEQTRILQSDLDQAWDLQRRLLPEHELEFGPYQLYGISVPERIVGGDFFNYFTFRSDSERIGVAIGDAASKGLSAAAQAFFVSGALMISVENETKISTMLRRINNLVKRIFPDDRFITVFYGEIFSGSGGLCLYANAGHSTPILYRAATNSISLLRSTGPVLGLLPDQNFGTNNINFSKGDILLLYTDGITEANNGQEEYTERRLTNDLLELTHHSAKEIAQIILERVQVFSANGEYSDDKTILVIKRVK